MRTFDLKIFLKVFIALCPFCLLQAQMSTISICINKEYEGNYRTTLKLRLPLDAEKQFYNLDINKSEVTQITDNTGFDFLKNGQGLIVENTYGNVSSDGSYYDLQVEIDGVPQKGATTFDMKGSFLINYVGDTSEENTLEFSFKENIQSSIDSEIGKIAILDMGGATLQDGTEYHLYTLDTETPIGNIEVIGGDDSEEYRNMGLGLEENTVVFKEAPEKIKIKVQTKSVQTEKVPFDLIVGIGF
ncbi:hypothetical protein [Allomuricauda sp. F6463D]|uniref:hypothetical protein n=1 Tax=Allomuricauda sp. F6463D TaxID=2926409 RepID=UPI001FF6AE54|nr:hypothetical protein [Muricauda sp. F6463D]MCK0161085.1 hypothetical protein [Muricauda sp. F6463D]